MRTVAQVERTDITETNHMNAPEKYDVLVLGGGTAGKLVGLDDGQRRKANRRRRSEVHRRAVSQHRMPCPARTSFIQRRSPRWWGGIASSGSRPGRSPSTWLEYTQRKREMVDGYYPGSSGQISCGPWTNIAATNSSSATPHSSHLAPFTSHCAMGANVRSPLTACS